MKYFKRIVLILFVILDGHFFISIVSQTTLLNRNITATKPNVDLNFYDALGSECGVVDEPNISEFCHGQEVEQNPKITNKMRFPSFVKVELGNDESNRRTCGGVIIHKDVILTTANCLGGFNPYKKCRVKAGLPREDEDQKPDNVQVKYGYAYCRMNYYRDRETLSGLPINGYWNDLALIQLDEPFTYNKYVGPACLKMDEQHAETAICYGVGRGHTIRGDATDKLYNRTHTVVLKRGGCIDEFKYGNTTSSTCYTPVNTDGLNLCKEDEGGPLYCMNDCSDLTKHVVRGLYSFGWETTRRRNSFTEKTIAGRAGYKENCGEYGKAGLYVDFFEVKKELQKVLEYCRENRT